MELLVRLKMRMLDHFAPQHLGGTGRYDFNYIVVLFSIIVDYGPVCNMIGCFTLI